jgi:hypothetical protein
MLENFTTWLGIYKPKEGFEHETERKMPKWKAEIMK